MSCRPPRATLLVTGEDEPAGIGRVGAATLISVVGDPTRFPTQAKFASFAGVAPLAVSSGDRDRHRVNRGGQRQINKILHTAAMTTCGPHPTSRVKPSEVETLRAWMAEARERSDEVLETFRNEGVRAEQFHLLETSDGPLMIVALVSEDVDVANAAFADSELPIDLEYQAVMDQVLDGRVEAENLLDLSLPDAT